MLLRDLVHGRRIGIHGSCVGPCVLVHLVPNCPFTYLLCFSRLGLGTLASAQICLLPVFVNEVLLRQPHSLVYTLSVATSEL